MLRQSVNSAATRYISAGAQAQASSANNASQMSQPRMRRDSGCEGTTIAAISGLTAGASIWVAMSAIAKNCRRQTCGNAGQVPGAPRAQSSSVGAGGAGGEFRDHLLQFLLISGLVGVEEGRHPLPEGSGIGLLLRRLDLCGLGAG